MKLAQCLRAHGVNVSDNGGAPGGDNGGGPPANLDRTKLRSAMQACRKYQSAAFGNVSQSQRQEFQDAFAKFSSCMRQHGVEVRDPTSGGGQAAGGGPGLDRNDPKVKAAQQACQSKLGNLPGRGPAGGGN